MKKIILLSFLALALISCGSSRNVSKKRNTVRTISHKNHSVAPKAQNIIEYAKSFEGTRYKFGGTTKRGMDCSGLVYTSFKNENIALPRVSRDMAKQGKRISLREVEEGDLLFFQTNKSRRVINHVGLVVESRKGAVKFIHSTTSRGVIVSSLNERYWNNAFVEVRRVI
ncbi:C40 family peptidase [Marixanthomonas spongiae]|uniref:Hydrolase n=1 Tax=Marixanthomonas spongiae TaxID=2174845 RepID=A0A2U0I7Y6_9FLAO|nr:C40 family peptidase [Marixanthomonas spongiae]PVW17184.1 hydrolase [Marixanthomonas spongiae]